ncbi:HPr family phosphocarrier protein [Caldanaerobius polysaccharolyticus]|uniref:HPr family phosphocarrier protein n=1 Tax=Caldanaerobius polysaccharolyticus TaxID=44256 RepID=UPI00047C0CD2|nr:HPr family phosphocarrier protein [Caldanaerobius polysaccharolyticus]
MVEKKAIVRSENGIHARPAMKINKVALLYKSNIIIIKDGNEYNARSIVSLMTMAAEKGDELIVRTEGADEEEAATAIVQALENIEG